MGNNYTKTSKAEEADGELLSCMVVKKGSVTSVARKSIWQKSEDSGEVAHLLPQHQGMVEEVEVEAVVTMVAVDLEG